VRRRWVIGLAIVGVALACRLPWSLLPRAVRWDEPDFLILARHLLRGEGYQVFGVPELIWPPGAPALTAVSLLVGVPIEQALAVWHALAGAVACGLLYGLSRDVTGDGRVAAISGLLAAVSPALAVWPLYWGSLTESIFLMFLLGGLWGIWRMLCHGRWSAGLAAGLALGAAYLTRPEGLIWWGGYLIIAIAVAAWRRRGWRAVVLYALSFLLVIAPYVGYLYHHTGRLMLSGKLGITIVLGMRVTELGSGLGHDYAAALDRSGKEIVWLSPERFEIGLADVVRTDPRGALRRLRRNLFKAWDLLPDVLLGLPIVGLIALGLWKRPWDRRRWAGEAFWLAAMVPVGVVPFFHVQPRLLLPLVPLALVWAARGVLHGAKWADAMAGRWQSGRSRQVEWAIVLVALLLIWGVWGQRVAAWKGQASLTPSHRTAGLWLAEHTAPGTPIMSRNPEVALYADRPLVAFPNATWPQVKAYALAHGACYLVVDDWEITRLRPQLSFLLDPEGVPPELEYVAGFKARRTTLVYRLRLEGLSCPPRPPG